MADTGKISLIAAFDQNGAIGKGGDLPWKISEDLQHFKKVTMGKPIVMGRKTFQSIGRALPGRTNIIVTRDRNYIPAPDTQIAHDLNEAISLARQSPGGDEVMIIGGADIYTQTLPLAGRLYLTEIDMLIDGADAFFPAVDRSEWRCKERETLEANISRPALTFITLDRV